MKAIVRSFCFALALVPFTVFAAPDMPAVPSVPATPSLPGKPALPTTPAMPSVPVKSGVPSTPAMPAAAVSAIDINSADATQLESLPGIGPTKAKAIVDYRTQNGPFQSTSDLEKVPGIGPKTMEQLAPLIMVKPGLPSLPGVKK